MAQAILTICATPVGKTHGPVLSMNWIPRLPRLMVGVGGGTRLGSQDGVPDHYILMSAEASGGRAPRACCCNHITCLRGVSLGGYRREERDRKSQTL